MNGYRVVNEGDLPKVLSLLQEGDAEGVKVRSLLQLPETAYSLFDICRGPFTLSKGCLSGYTNRDEKATLRIAPSLVHNVELRISDGPWYAPEMGSIVLLLRETAT